MKHQTLRTLVLAVCFCGGYLSAQDKWQWIAPSPQGNTILSSASAGNRVYFLAEASTVFSTSDNGETWSLAPPLDGRYDEVHYADFVHHRLAFAGDLRGFITQWSGMYTLLPGTTDWIDQPGGYVGTGNVYFSSQNVGWLGGSLTRTTDGGDTWQPMSIDVTGDFGYVHAFTSTDEMNGWLVTSTAAMRRTTDGGATWTNVTTGLVNSPDTSFILLDVKMLPTGIGIVSGIYRTQPNSVGGGIVLRTTNSGSSWGRTYFVPQYASVLAPSDSVFVLIGNDRWGQWGSAYQTSIIRSTDAGNTWNGAEFPAEGQAPLTAVWHEPTQTMFAAGHYGVIYRSLDLGASWHTVSGDSRLIHDIGFFKRSDDENVGYAVGAYGSVFVSKDDGNSWDRREIPELTGGFVKAIGFSGSKPFVAGGHYLFRSPDDGDSWLEVTTPVEDTLVSFEALSILEGKFAVAVATYSSFVSGDSYFLSSVDSGMTWDAKLLPEKLHARAAHIPDENVAFIGGVDWRDGNIGKGFTARTTDRGDTWTITELESPVTCMYFQDALRGTCGGYGGLYYTSDSASSWTRHTNIVINHSVEDIWFRNLDEGYCTIESTVYQTTNRGVTWYPYRQLPTNLGGKAIASSMTGYLYGSIEFGGMVSDRLTPIVITHAERSWEQDRIPSSAQLLQNYPNPFNPSTEISFQIPREEHARLSIFDLLGREVALLVDDTRPAGRYTARWSAGNLPSGLYVARLKAGGTGQTIKLLLMK